MQASKFRVAICGSGIGGLVHACALARYPSISVRLYEASSELSPNGAGIGMWPRTWEVLKRLGLADELKKVSLCFSAKEESMAFSFRKSDQPKGYEFFSMQGRGSLITFHRGDLQRKLIQQIPPQCQIQYSKRLQSYSRDNHGGINLHFSNGSIHTCDLLVGADGIRSFTRASLLREQSVHFRKRGRPQHEIETLEGSIEPEFSGYVAYRSVFPIQRFQERVANFPLPKSPVMFLGKNSSILAYPIALGQMMNLVVFDFKKELKGSIYPGAWSEIVDSSQLYNITSFENWEPLAQGWLKCIDHPTKWAIHTVKPLPTFISYNVALIGDAAHAFTPHQGTGAGQAIEDAYILAELLGHSRTTRDTIPRALRIYDSVRRPWVQKVARRAEVNGHYLALNFEDFDFEAASSDVVDKKLQKMGELLADNWKWSWNSSVQDSLKHAIRMLETQEDTPTLISRV